MAGASVPTWRAETASARSSVASAGSAPQRFNASAIACSPRAYVEQMSLRNVKEGESFVELPNQVAQTRNAGSVPARVMASFLIPPGAPLPMPQMAPAALPNTSADETSSLSGWLLIALIALIGGGWLRWRRVARSIR
jgi:LPXTG-motif cell wall-anchored protein